MMASRKVEGDMLVWDDVAALVLEKDENDEKDKKDKKEG